MHPQSTANSCQKKERHSKNHRQLSLSTLTQVETAHQEGLRFLAKFPCCEFEWQGSSRFADFTLRFLCFGIIHEHWLLLWQRNFNVWQNKQGKRRKKILHTADNVFASQPAETVCFSSEFSPHTVRHCVPSYCCCCCWIKVLCWAILLSVDDGHSLAVITVGAQTTAQMQPHLYTTNSLVQQRIATDSLFQAEKIENY